MSEQVDNFKFETLSAETLGTLQKMEDRDYGNAVGSAAMEIRQLIEKQARFIEAVRKCRNADAFLWHGEWWTWDTSKGEYEASGQAKIEDILAGRSQP